MTEEELISEYMNSLSNDEKYALEVAKKYLGSTYDLVKSNGFITWKASQS